MAVEHGNFPENRKTAPEQTERNREGVGRAKAKSLARLAAPEKFLAGVQLPLDFGLGVEIVPFHFLPAVVRAGLLAMLRPAAGNKSKILNQIHHPRQRRNGIRPPAAWFSRADIAESTAPAPAGCLDVETAGERSWCKIYYGIPFLSQSVLSIPRFSYSRRRAGSARGRQNERALWHG